MRAVCLSLLFGLVSGAFAADRDPSKKDKEAIQGAWEMDGLEFNGEDLKGKYKFSFLVEKDVMSLDGDDDIKKEYPKFKLVLDPNTMPKCIDLTVAGGVQKDVKLEGIYELKGDVLRLCVKVGGTDRPSEFKSPDGASIALITLKRQK